ncbi:hom family outer membrane protein [Helicobacter acinonychis]|uniref:Hom-family outer membrane protein n=1 Tax=Helicobacter acinonychis (strain Sheeba) TaxID=382638 RepID=Q17WY2_HELAH|nr:hom-family outer membrane protein [Helicobacter acinonychis str. Sheeba]STP04393.1 hom family outer membrane protein [Helicobacter acinonychis]
MLFIFIFSALEAHQKDGFFIEAEFETGLLEGVQTQEKIATVLENGTRNTTKYTAKNTTKTYSYLPKDTILKGAANLFTTAEAISKLKFSTKNPISAFVSNGNLNTENFLPYNLNTVEISFYYVLKKYKGVGNLDAASGFNYRYKYSQFSVGVSL